MSPFCLATALLLATAVPGRREAIEGTVYDRAGKPKAGAEVVFVGRPLPWTEQIGKADIVRTKTNAKGEFRAQLLAARPYSAWAAWSKGKNGGRATAALDSVVAGRAITLQEAKLGVDRRVQLDGTEKWADRGPLSLRVRPLMETMWSRPMPISGGVATVPLVSLSKPRGDVEVVAKDGSILKSVPMLLTSRSSEPEVIDVGRIYKVALRVMDADTGKPIAGAIIRRRPWSSPERPFPAKPWGKVGETAADGSCKLRILSKSSPLKRPDRVSESWAVQASGYADGLLGCDSGRFFVGHRAITTRGVRQVQIRLHKARPLTGQVQLANGQPAIGVPVVVRAEWPLAGRRPNKSVHDALLLPYYYAKTDENGRWMIEGLPVQTTAIAACMLLSRASCKDLPNWESSEHPVAAALAPFDASLARPASLGVVDLSKFARVRVRYAPPSGAKMQGLEVRVYPKGQTRSPLAFDTRRFTDASGRIGLLLRKGVEHTVFAFANDTGWAMHTVTPSGSTAVETVRLERFVTVKGRVLRPDRTPIENAWVLRARDKRTDRPGVEGDIWRLNKDLLMTWTDDKGRFQLRYVPNPHFPPKLLAIAKHTQHGPQFRSRLLALGKKPKTNVDLVVDQAEDWLTSPKK